VSKGSYQIHSREELNYGEQQNVGKFGGRHNFRRVLIGGRSGNRLRAARLSAARASRTGTGFAVLVDGRHIVLEEVPADGR
jgi:hypothetical protein